MTSDECYECLSITGRSMKKDWDKLCAIPGIYRNRDSSIIFSFYYILSHRIPEFYDGDKKILLKDVINKSPIYKRINSSSVETLTQAFA